MEYTVGYKIFENNFKGKHKAEVSEPSLYISGGNLPRTDKNYKKEYYDSLKEALLASIGNSGKFDSVRWKEEDRQESNSFQLETFFYAQEEMNVGYYPYNPSLFLFFIPFRTEYQENELRLFWPTLVPGLYPLLGLQFPFLAKSGTVRLSLNCRITYKGKVLKQIEIQKQDSYSLMFYGVYRTALPERISILLFERALEELTLELADLEL